MPVINSSPYFIAPPPSGWDLSTFSYDSVVFNSTVGGTWAYGMAASPQGHRLYVTDQQQSTIRQTVLGTDWDLSSASSSGGVTLGTTSVAGITFKPDGTKMYVTDNSGNIRQYSISVPWSVSAGTTSLDETEALGFLTATYSVRFSPDGMNMYTARGATQVDQYTLSGAWDITTLTYVNSWVSGSTNGIDFKTDGTKIFRAANTGDTIYEHSLGTAWDISTVNGTPDASLSVNPPESGPTAIVFKPDGLRFMLLGVGSPHNIYQFSSS